MIFKAILIISSILIHHVSGYKIQRGERYEQFLEDEFEAEKGVTNLSEDNEERTAMEQRIQEREGSLCDLSGYGGNLKGEYQLRIWNHHHRYVAKVYCTNDMCTPLDTAITGACDYVCGSDTCPPHDPSQSSTIPTIPTIPAIPTIPTIPAQ